MNDVLLQYLATRILEDIRSGRGVNDQLAAACNRLPYVDQLRLLVREEDAPGLLAMTTAADDGVRALAWSLLKGVEDLPAVRAEFNKLWTGRSDFSTRYRVLWRLLDYPDLDLGRHQEIYTFVCEHWDDFLSGLTPFYGDAGDEDFLSVIAGRLEKSPETKAWVYLCCLMASPDREAVEDSLNRYRDRGDSMAKRVAQDLLLRLRAHAATPNGETEQR